MAFNFPDPAVETTVTNPLTGATYQWKADPGKWVLAGGSPPAPDTYFPFTSSYTLVHPDKYTGADGTCTAETDAYVNDPDTNFNSPGIKKWRFANYDLNGQPFSNSSGNIKYFDYVQYPRNTSTGGGIQYGTFETTAQVGYQDWEGNVAFNRYLNLTEDAEVHIRYPSVESLLSSGIVSVQDTPPLTPETGSLWYDTEDDELTLYIYTGAEWVPAAPPVSLDGINSTIDAALIVQNDLRARVQAGEAEQSRQSADIQALQETDYVSRTGDTMSAELIIDQPSGSALTLKKDGVTTLQFWTDGTATTEKTTFNDKDLVAKTYVDSRTASYNPYGRMQLTVKSVDAAMNLNDGHIVGYSSTYSNTFFDHWKVEVKIKADDNKVTYRGDDSITTAGEIPVHGVLKILTEDGSTLLFESLISSIEYVSGETPKYYRLKMFKQQQLYGKTGAGVSSIGKVKAYFYVN